MFSAKRLVTFTVLGLLLLLAAMPSFAQNRSHVVARGDTLYNISVRYGVSMAAIQSVNGLANANLIYVGQTLIIPAAGYVPPAQPSNVTYYIVRTGDTLSGIAVRYCTTVDGIASASGINRYSPIYPNQRLTVPVGVCSNPVPTVPTVPTYPSGSYYVVRPGDNLFKIASTYGVNIYRIAEANRLLNLNLIYAGLPLFIPR
jgi:LysM repeat protein